tara:strand:+ start:7803 stop:8594 length:792 start_codon:yes stop_codon:yes gene_type:complete
MKMNLLELVQDIGNDLDSDEINSIDDTTESQQIAQIVKSTYFAMMSNRNWPHLKRALQITASGDLTYPTHMKLEDEVKELSFINYNSARLGTTTKQYMRLTWVEPDDFLRVLNNRRSDAGNVDTIVDPSGVELFIVNDQPPQYYTSFDDSTIIFDAYDRSVDLTLQSSKTQASGYIIPEWLPTDDYIPDLPTEAFTALLEEAKSRSSLKLRQVQDIKAEQEASRQQRWLSRKAKRVAGGVRYPNYGRRGQTSRKDVTFKVGKY